MGSVDGVDMDMEIQKRHIGVIPPHEFKNKKYIEDFRKVILPGWPIIPHTLFYKISYERLINVSRSGAAFDVVIASRMKDANHPEINNIYSAALEIRGRLSLPTVFIISYNELLATVLDLDPKAEKACIQKLIEHGNNPGPKSIGGIARTTGTDPTFLVSIVADILDGPGKYLQKTQVCHIESQAHFLNHPPGHTQVGIGR